MNATTTCIVDVGPLFGPPLCDQCHHPLPESREDGATCADCLAGSPLAVCNRCGESFQTTPEYAKVPGCVCGSCGDDLRQEADADRAIAEYDAEDHSNDVPDPDAAF